MAGSGIEAAIARLAAARPGVREDERHQIDKELGRLYWVAGKPQESLKAYAAVLEYQADDPDGLWGTALAHALAGDWDAAWSVYDQAVRLRTGVVDLRADYARDLLRAGETERARDQVEEGLLLDPDDPNLLAMKAWCLVAEGDAAGGAAVADSALSANPWCDAARIVLAMARARAGTPADAESVLAPILDRLDRGAPPQYVYRPKWARYDQVATLPHVERELISVLRGDRER
jgi:tetratricopeptide (TPR) repeat protein